ncbi:MAG TPA: hypothetical protein VMA37_09820 [Acetobacteraceae bacterium]|nr:hypothetical protein [Acetobacteraceae bacterium]
MLLSVSRGRQSSRAFALLALVTFLVPSIVEFVPWRVQGPWFPRDFTVANLGDLNVDLSFMIALPALLREHVQYGPEAVFTYGPLGFLMYGLSPSSFFYPVLLFNLAFAAINSTTLAYLLIVIDVRPALRCLLWLGFLLTNYLYFVGWSEAYWLLPACLVPCIHFIKHRGENRGQISRELLHAALLASSTVMAGAVSYVKFNFFVLNGISFLLLGCYDVINRRRLPGLTILYTASLLASWVLCGQALTNLPEWVARCWDLSAGYGDAMGKGFWAPFGLITVVWFYLCAAIPWIIFAVTIPYRRRAANPFFLIAFFAVISGISIKHGVSGNQIESALAQLLTSQLLLIALVADNGGGSKTGTSIVRRRAVSALLAASAATLLLPIRTAGDTGSDFYQVGTSVPRVVRGLEEMIAALLGDSGAWAEPWDRLMASIRASLPLPAELHGRADIYPQQTGVVIADPALTYAPRPAYLSLNAHTRRLAQANADYLRSDRAPDVIAFQILPDFLSVNKRLPATQDGPSWPELLARYQLSSTTPDFLILQHRHPPLERRLRPLGKIEAQWGQQIPLPPADSGLLWAEVEVERSPIGKAIDLVYKSPQILMTSVTGGGSASYQLVPELGAAGFLLSPLVTDTTGFAALEEGLEDANFIAASDTVRSISFTSPDAPAGFWNAPIAIRLYELSFSGAAQEPKIGAYANLLTLMRLRQHVSACQLPPTVQLEASIDAAILFAHAPCRIDLPIVVPAHHLRLGFGLRASAIAGPSGKTKGAEFRVSLRRSDTGETQLVWSRILDPATAPADRGQQTAEIPLNAKPGDTLVLETRPGPTGQIDLDHTYWSQLDLRE